MRALPWINKIWYYDAKIILQDTLSRYRYNGIMTDTDAG